MKNWFPRLKTYFPFRNPPPDEINMVGRFIRFLLRILDAFVCYVRETDYGLIERRKGFQLSF